MRIGFGIFQAFALPAARFPVEPRCVPVLCLGLSLVSGLSARPIEIEGRPYVDSAAVAARFGMQSGWLRNGETYRLRSQWTTIDLKKHGKMIRFNEMPIYMGFPSVESGGRSYVSQADYRHVIQPIIIPQVFQNRPGFKRIVIDAGHGGKDHGATNEAFGLKEKVLAADVAARLKILLDRNGFDVVLTRNTDAYIPLSERPQTANRIGADLFISIHFNAAESKTAAGLETFALTPQYQASSKYARPSRGDAVRHAGNDYDPWNVLLAYHVQRGLVRGMGGPDRGIKRARFAVLKELKCPGVLVELGFLSHSGTARKLRSSAYRRKLTQSLLEGILAYRRRLIGIG